MHRPRVGCGCPALLRIDETTPTTTTKPTDTDNKRTKQRDDDQNATDKTQTTNTDRTTNHNTGDATTRAKEVREGHPLQESRLRTQRISATAVVWKHQQPGDDS